MTPQSPTNFGIKVSKAGVNVNNATDNQLLYKNDYNAETFFGSTGSISFGNLMNGGQGMQVVDSTGFVLFELQGQTWYWYDKNYGTNVMQVGLLPDGSYGWAVATQGNNVADAFKG